MACHASGRLRLPHDAPWALSGPKVCHSEPERHLNRTQTHISIYGFGFYCRILMNLILAFVQCCSWLRHLAAVAVRQASREDPYGMHPSAAIAGASLAVFAKSVLYSLAQPHCYPRGGPVGHPWGRASTAAPEERMLSVQTSKKCR